MTDDPTENPKKDGDRYQKAYEWSLRVFDQQIERYKRQERKAARYLTGAGILLGVIGFSSGSIANRLFPLTGAIEFATLVAGIATIGSLGCLCFHCFQVLQTEDLKVLPGASKIADLFHDHGKQAVFDRLSQDVAQAAQTNRDVTLRMGNFLESAHKALIGVSVSVVLFGVGLVTTEAFSDSPQINPKIELRIVMPDEEGASQSGESGGSSGGNGSSSGGESSGGEGRPGDAIEPIEFPTIQESEDPDHTTKLDSDNQRDNSESESPREDSSE